MCVFGQKAAFIKPSPLLKALFIDFTSVFEWVTMLWKSNDKAYLEFSFIIKDALQLPALKWR